MKESILKTDKNIVFRETFGSEDLVRANGGMLLGIGTFPTNFTNGTLTFNNASNCLNYAVALKGTYSVRIRYASAFIGKSSLPIVDFRDNGSNTAVKTGLIYGNTPTLLSPSSGTAYINGVASTTLSADTREIVISGITLDSLYIILGRFSGSSSYWDGNTWELLEIYNGTLTANEVKNLYEQRQNREIYNHLGQLDTTTDASFVVSASLPPDTFVTSGNNVTSVISDGSSIAGFYSTVLASAGAIGDFYRVRFTAVRTSGNLTFVLAGTPDTISGAVSDNYTIATSGDYDFYIRRSSASSGYPTFFSAAAYNLSITNFRINKAVVNPISEILRVDARNGVISNKYTGSTTGTELGSVLTLWSKSGTVTDSGNAVQFVPAQTNYIYKSIGSVNKRYLIAIKASSTANGDTIRVYQGATAGATAVTLTTSPITYTAIITDTSSSTMYIQGLTGSGTVTVELISIQEIIPAVTPTAVSVVRSGNVYAMDFNGTTSKIDCGSYDTLVGDKTLVAWINPRGPGETAGRIIDNAQFAVNVVAGVTTVDRIRFTRNYYASFVDAANNSLLYSGYKWTMLVITSTSTGISNIFYNAVLNGTANQAGGTPTVSSNSICIGNRVNADRTFDGQISNVRIYDGILSTQEIAQLYQSEKGLYNL